MRKYWSAAPDGVAVGKYFLSGPCLQAVVRIGCVCIAVLSVSGSIRTPAQEDKVCTNVMDNERLIRILTGKLQSTLRVSYWPLRQRVEEAVTESTRFANEIDELVEELHKRIVRFSYRKTDGTVREAIGTLKPGVLNMLSVSSKPKPRNQGNRGCVVYFDLDREDWRCFCPENFITIHP